MNCNIKSFCGFLILLIFALTACSSPKKNEIQTNKEPNKKLESSKKIVLQFWAMPNSPEPKHDLDALLADFEEQNPNIDVEITVLDWGSAWPKITTAATSGETPDIVQLGTTWVGSISSMNTLWNLHEKVNELGGKDIFIPSGWRTSGIINSGIVSAIPWFIDVRALFYRRDVFKKLGLTDENLKNWDSFKETLKIIKEANLTIDEKNVAPLGIPGKNDWNVIHNFAPWIWAGGGDFLNPDLKTSALNSQMAVQGLSFYVNLVKEGLIPLECLELNTAQVSSNFNNGNYALYFDGPYEIKTLTTPPEQGGASTSIAAKNFSVVNYPEGSAGRFTFVGGSNLAIFKTSKHKEKAWKVLKFLLQKEQQLSYCKNTGFLPARLDVFDNSYFTSDPNRKIYKEAVQYGRTYPCIPSWGLLEPILTRRFGIMWDKVLESNDSTSIEELVSSQLSVAAKEMNSVLEERISN
jgi:multiple sugar transport system substrate-binding protein